MTGDYRIHVRGNLVKSGFALNQDLTERIRLNYRSPRLSLSDRSLTVWELIFEESVVVENAGLGGVGHGELNRLSILTMAIFRDVSIGLSICSCLL